MQKTKWDDAEEPTINNFYKINNREFRICSLKCGLTEVMGDGGGNENKTSKCVNNIYFVREQLEYRLNDRFR